LKIEPIGTVRMIDPDRSRIELDAVHAEGLGGLVPGDRLDVLYWMHELPANSHRAMQVHPRGDKGRAKRGVFALRSPMRPNPIGVSSVELLEVRQSDLLVQGLDAHDGSPVIDIKAARRNTEAERLLDMWGKVHNKIISALASELGRQQLEHILREPLRGAGREAAKESRTNASEIGRAILAIEKLWRIEGRVVQDTSEQFVREVNKCPWSFFTPLGCEIFAWWMEGYCRGLNDRYAYTLEQSVPEGAESCIWAIRKRNSDP